MQAGQESSDNWWLAQVTTTMVLRTKKTKRTCAQESDGAWSRMEETLHRFEPHCIVSSLHCRL